MWGGGEGWVGLGFTALANQLSILTGCEILVKPLLNKLQTNCKAEIQVKISFHNNN